MSQKKASQRIAKYAKAGNRRPPALVSYRDSAGKRHWAAA